MVPQAFAIPYALMDFDFIGPILNDVGFLALIHVWLRSAT